VTELHRYLALVAGVFIGLHGALLLLDRVQPLSLGQELLPFSSSYRPFAVGLGVVAAELLAAVGVSNALRDRIPYRAWRRIHFLTLAVWVLASAHLVLAGTDRGEPWLVGLLAGAWCAAALAASVRLLAPSRGKRLA